MAQTVVSSTDDPEEGLTIWQHLGELRDRLFKTVIALAVGIAIGSLLAPTAFDLIIKPYGDKLLVTSPTEGLTNYFVVALTVGVTLSLPFMVFQIFGFVSPGLYDNEKKWIYVAVPFGTVLFVLGVSFAWFIMLPAAIPFLTSILPNAFKYQLTPNEYVPFVMSVLFWMGAAFEMPLVIFILAKANVVSSRILIKQWRYAIIVIAIMAAVVTPTPDPINMSIVMMPLLLLYVFSIGLAALARRNATTPAFLDPEEKVKDTTDK